MSVIAPLRVEYENRFADMVIFNTVHQLLSPVLQMLYGGMALLIFAVEQMSSEPVVAVIVAITIFVLMWAVQAVVNVLYLFSRKNHSVLTRHVIEIRPDGLYEETKYNQSIFFWPGVVKAVRRLSYVAVYVTPHLAHIVPSRAFESREHARAFRELIEERIRAA